MSEPTFENLLNQIAPLPVEDKMRLIAALNDQIRRSTTTSNGGQFVKPIPEPDPEPNRRWMAAHKNEYAGQWVAIDGDRLIAHGKDADEVFAEVGENLGIDVPTGIPKSMGSLTGTLETFGHEIAIQSCGVAVQSVAYFAKYHSLPRNLLGRNGWIRKLRLSVVDYDNTIYLSPYNP
jgi:hypothetical protein